MGNAIAKPFEAFASLADDIINAPLNLASDVFDEMTSILPDEIGGFLRDAKDLGRDVASAGMPLHNLARVAAEVGDTSKALREAKDENAKIEAHNRHVDAQNALQAAKDRAYKARGQGKSVQGLHARTGAPRKPNATRVARKAIAGGRVAL